MPTKKEKGSFAAPERGGQRKIEAEGRKRPKKEKGSLGWSEIFDFLLAYATKLTLNAAARGR